MKILRLSVTIVLLGLTLLGNARAEDGSPQSILKQALLGAGTGALSAELSGGKAGKGALIGAGTNIIGGALFSTLFSSPLSSSAPAYYAAPTPTYHYAPQPQPTYAQPVYYYQQPRETAYAQPASYPSYTYPSTQTDTNRMMIRQGLLGAGVGAISAETSGGKAGTGALVGAGTSIIGNVLFDVLLSPQRTQSPARSYSSAPASYSQPSQRKIVRHFDASGKLVSEEEFFI